MTPQEALSAAAGRWNAGDLDGYLALYDEAEPRTPRGVRRVTTRRG